VSTADRSSADRSSYQSVSVRSRSYFRSPNQNCKGTLHGLNGADVGYISKEAKGRKQIRQFKYPLNTPSHLLVPLPYRASGRERQSSSGHTWGAPLHASSRRPSWPVKATVVFLSTGLKGTTCSILYPRRLSLLPTAPVTARSIASLFSHLAESAA
jgi:hypothetical protein